MNRKRYRLQRALPGDQWETVPHNARPTFSPTTRARMRAGKVVRAFGGDRFRLVEAGSREDAAAVYYRIDATDKVEPFNAGSRTRTVETARSEADAVRVAEVFFGSGRYSGCVVVRMPECVAVRVVGRDPLAIDGGDDAQ